MKRKIAYILALVLLVSVGWYMYSGTTTVSSEVDAASAASSPDGRQEENTEDLFRVKVMVSEAAPRQSTLEINGRMEAFSKVVVKAETSGLLLERPIEKGMSVTKGETLCKIDNGTRNAKLLEAQARLENAETNYSSSVSLRKSGFSTENQVANFKATRDSAQARVDEAMKEIENTTIAAPISGRIESPIAEVGSYLSRGGTCATIIMVDPMLAIGQVSERDIDQLELGMGTQVNTLTGEAVEGTVSYISHTANTDTRTFRVEVEVPNADGRFRDGVSATMQFQLASEPLHKINSSSLTLDGGGRIGVQTVNEQNVVEFVPVELSGGENDGLWVTGIPESAKVITVGQEYVVQGQKVIPVFEEN